VVQQAQVLPGSLFGPVAPHQQIVGHAEPGRREQVLTIPVVGEGAGLAHQRVDDVPVVDRVLVGAHQARQRIDPGVRVPHLDAIGEQARLDHLTDQARVDRVGVLVDVDQAPRIDPTVDAPRAVEARLGQRAQGLQLLLMTCRTRGIACGQEVGEEVPVLVWAGEVATAAHQKGLIDGALEVPMGALVVAVLVGLTHVDALTGQRVVVEQVLIAGAELALGREVVDGRGQAVTAVACRHATQFPQRVLEPIGEGLEGLGEAEGNRLPVGVGQDEMIEQVVERLPGDGDTQLVHGGEVGTGQIGGVMDLGELDIDGGSVRGLPVPDPALECAPVRVSECAGVLNLEPLEEGHGQQARFLFESRGDRVPDPGEGIGACAVGARLLVVAGQGGARAVLACGLVGHVRPPGGLSQWRSAL
jgi:hypothetical protein